MKIEFFKYQGTGNDFIIMDNRDGVYSSLLPAQVKHLCDRRFGIGADGLMLLNDRINYDFEMKYYNADGNESSMCGNGGRCLVRFASHVGIQKSMYRFIAIDGDHIAEIDHNNNEVRLKMKDVNHVEKNLTHSVLNTGSPHYVKFVADVAQLDVYKAGHEIRNSAEFAKEGINVNFVETLSADTIYVRTYERGVEDETLSCGTGVTASALIAAHNENGFNHVNVKTPGGSLSVEYEKINAQHFRNIWLCGPATSVYKGAIDI